jgi:hypothetical protein
MQRVCCLLILLLHAFSIYAMEIVTSDKSGGIQDIDDNVLTSLICPRLDRPTRDALRCACKKYSTLVYSQDELNEKYGEACDKKDTNKITHWKNLGGCYFYQ